MEIKFFRGDDHLVKFKFKTYTGPIDKIYFTVKDENREVRLHKWLGNGISKEDDYYVITFIPKDTDDLPYWLKLTYDIQIEIEGKKYTIAKDKFTLEEDITRPAEEV